MEETKKIKVKKILMTILKWVVGIVIAGLLLWFVIGPFLWWLMCKIAYWGGFCLAAIVCIGVFIVILFGG